jgi:hypothetical protein
VDSLWICLVGNEWVKEWTPLRTTRCKMGPLVIWANTFGETSAGTVKLGEAIEKPYSDVLAHTPEVGSQSALCFRSNYCSGLYGRFNVIFKEKSF